MGSTRLDNHCGTHRKLASPDPRRRRDKQANAEAKHLAFLVTERGEPFTAAGFGIGSDRCDGAGITDFRRPWAPKGRRDPSYRPRRDRSRNHGVGSRKLCARFSVTPQLQTASGSHSATSLACSEPLRPARCDVDLWKVLWAGRAAALPSEGTQTSRQSNPS